MIFGTLTLGLLTTGALLAAAPLAGSSGNRLGADLCHAAAAGRIPSATRACATPYWGEAVFMKGPICSAHLSESERQMARPFARVATPEFKMETT